MGSWSEDVLTVETTHLAGGVVFTSRGYPVSPEARITERYWREAGKNLQMELLIDDPVNYLPGSYTHLTLPTNDSV